MNPWASLQAQQQAVLSAPAIQQPAGHLWAGQSATSTGGSSAATPFGVSPSHNFGAIHQVQNMPQHANTAPTLPSPSPQSQMVSQSTGMLSPGNGMMFPRYQQQRSASLGTMAFSTSPLPSPGFANSNPFNAMQSNFATSLPQTPNYAGTTTQSQQQQQQLGQVAFQGQNSNTMFHSNGTYISQQQPFIQVQPASNGMGQFQSSMMPNAFGQAGQYGSPFGQHSQQQQQHTQQGTQFSNMW